MTQDDGERLVSVREVADLLGVSVRSVWRMAEQGKIPQPVRYSRKMVRWQLSLILASIEEKAHDRTTE